MPPERRVVALGGRVMQHEEVADFLELDARQRVEFVDGRLIEPVAREHEQQPRDRGEHQVDAGRFERLEETAREAERDAILLPDLLAPPGHETQRPRRVQRLAVEPAEQQARRLVVAHELAAVHVAVAGAVLQRNAPLPAGFARGGARVGSGGRDALAGHGHRRDRRAGIRSSLRSRRSASAR